MFNSQLDRVENACALARNGLFVIVNISLKPFIRMHPYIRHMKIAHLKTALLVSLAVATAQPIFAQIDVVERRFVPQENIEAFIHRETTYWSEIAKQAIREGKLESWSLWQQVDGFDMDKKHNFIFIRTYPGGEALDLSTDIWDPQKVFPRVNPSRIDTLGLSTVKDVLYYYRFVHVQRAQAQYIRVNFSKASDLTRYLELEETVWLPFVMERMDSGKTNVVSWTLAQLVMPRGTNAPHNAVTIDGFSTLSGALRSVYGDDARFPDFEEFRAVHQKVDIHLHRLIKAVGPEDMDPDEAR